MKSKSILVLAMVVLLCGFAPMSFATVVYHNDFNDGSNSLNNFLFGKVGASIGSYDIDVFDDELRIRTYLPTPIGAYAAINTSNFLSPYTNILGNNQELVTWSFNVANQDGKYNNSFSFALASSAPDARLYTSSCYVFEGGGMVGNRMALFRQIGPDLGGPSYTPIIDITDGLRPLPKQGAIKVTYDPATNIWSLYAVIGTEKTNPENANILLGTCFDDTLTNIHLPYMSLSGRTTGSDFFDNITVSIVPKPATTVAVDIKPGSCPNPLNVKSKGVLPVAILGTADYDITTIDPTSVRLDGVEPLRSGYEDVAGPVSDGNDCNCTEDGPDGYLDLTLKFETQKIVEAVGDVNDGDELQLELIGVLFDETPIEGADCIVIRGRHKPINPADINKDGVVNAADFAIFAQNWLQSSIVEE